MRVRTSRKKNTLRTDLERGTYKVDSKKRKEFWIPVNSCKKVFCGPGSTGGHHLITPVVLKEVTGLWGRSGCLSLRHPSYGEASRQTQDAWMTWISVFSQAPKYASLPFLTTWKSQGEAAGSVVWFITKMGQWHKHASQSSGFSVKSLDKRESLLNFAVTFICRSLGGITQLFNTQSAAHHPTPSILCPSMSSTLRSGY